MEYIWNIYIYPTDVIFNQMEYIYNYIITNDF